MRTFKRMLIGLVVVVAVLVTAGLLTTQRFRAPSESMEPNVGVGERLLVWRLGYSPHVGDMEVSVPPGRWLVLGDNRGASNDSRLWGTVPAKAFVGRRLLTYWG